jgi:hypothetical protein
MKYVYLIGSLVSMGIIPRYAHVQPWVLNALPAFTSTKGGSTRREALAEWSRIKNFKLKKKELLWQYKHYIDRLKH